MANTKTVTGSWRSCPNCRGRGVLPVYDETEFSGDTFWEACPALCSFDPALDAYCIELPVSPEVRGVLGEALMCEAGLEDVLGDRPHSSRCECDACDEWTWRDCGGCVACWMSPCKCARAEAA